MHAPFSHLQELLQKTAEVTYEEFPSIYRAKLYAKHSFTNASWISIDLLRHDKSFVLSAVTQNGKAFERLSKTLKSDKEVILAKEKYFILRNLPVNKEALAYAPDELKNDKDFMLAAVRLNGLALKDASDRIQNDRKIVAEAIMQNYWAYTYASETLKKEEPGLLRIAHSYSRIHMNRYKRTY